MNVQELISILKNLDTKKDPKDLKIMVKDSDGYSYILSKVELKNNKVYF